ncbi:MAG: AraC family transcriptional regulator [Verrucomicrobiota bacterium]
MALSTELESWTGGARWLLRDERMTMAWCEGSAARDCGWRGLVDSNSVEFILNVRGTGYGWIEGEEPVRLSPGVWMMAAGVSGNKWGWNRERGSGHGFLRVSYKRDFFEQVATVSGDRWAIGEGTRLLRGLSGQELRGWGASVLRPSAGGALSPLYFRAKAMEFLALLEEMRLQAGGGGFFCSLQNRLAEERVSRVKKWLADRLDEPLDLEAAAKAVGVSASALSRTFSEVEGVTLRRYLRAERAHWAASLLAEGRLTVSEVGTEVGYRSLSQFTRAFREEKGCVPSQFARAN